MFFVILWSDFLDRFHFLMLIFFSSVVLIGGFFFLSILSISCQDFQPCFCGGRVLLWLLLGLYLGGFRAGWAGGAGRGSHFGSGYLSVVSGRVWAGGVCLVLHSASYWPGGYCLGYILGGYFLADMIWAGGFLQPDSDWLGGSCSGCSLGSKVWVALGRPGLLSSL